MKVFGNNNFNPNPNRDPADEYGWYEDLDSPRLRISSSLNDFHQSSKARIDRTLSLPPPATQPPMYILESSHAEQQLWYETAGTKPRQPEHERAYFTRLWLQNFETSLTPNAQSLSSMYSELVESNSIYDENTDELSKTIDENGSEILFKGKNIFSNAVSKSFINQDCANMTMQLPRFKIVKGKDGKIYATFLVIVSLGSVSFGSWRRHSEFSKFAENLISSKEEGDGSEFRNSMLSWQCLLQKKRWYRCLDKEYLALKCFLLERFMHDVLFESRTPDLILRFLDLMQSDSISYYGSDAGIDNDNDFNHENTLNHSQDSVTGVDIDTGGGIQPVAA
jgi:hypothetical protein